MNPDEFMAAVNDHRILYLKGSDRKVFFKKTYEDSYVLGHVAREVMTQGFQLIANKLDQMTFSKNWFWLSTGGIVICDLCSDEWEVGA